MPEHDPEPPAAAAFHAHLETCTRCASDVFALCPIGSGLLDAAAIESNPAIGINNPINRARASRVPPPASKP